MPESRRCSEFRIDATTLVGVSGLALVKYLCNLDLASKANKGASTTSFRASASFIG